MGEPPGACLECARRRWLIERLAPHLDRERRRIDDLLGLADLALIRLIAGADRAALLDAHEAFSAADARRIASETAAVGLEPVCRHGGGYPGRLTELEAPPAMLAVNGGVERLGELCAAETVAIVGTRRPSEGGTVLAHAMARDLVAAGVTVISGMAYGIDSAAHLGALEAGPATVAVLAGSAALPYPAGRARLFRDLLGVGGVVISELGPEMETTWRWALQARNRLIAGLADLVVLVEGPERSGALITVRHADALGRQIGAVPGAVGQPQSAGPNQLLAKARAGAREVNPGRVAAVRGAQDVLDLLYGEGIIELGERIRPAPTAREASLLGRIAEGLTNVTMVDPGDLAALSGLELKGWVQCGAGGALRLVPA